MKGWRSKRVTRWRDVTFFFFSPSAMRIGVLGVLSLLGILEFEPDFQKKRLHPNKNGIKFQKKWMKN
jgi:hypothetical protein